MIKKRLQDIALNITDGKHGDCEGAENSGFYFISCKDVHDGAIHYDGARQITEKDFLDTHKRTMLEPNDILVTNSGTIGRMALVSQDGEVTPIASGQAQIAVSFKDLKKTIVVTVQKTKAELIKEENTRYEQEKQSLLDQKNQMVDAAQSQLDSLLAYGGYYYGTEYDYQRELSSANQEVLKYQKIVAALEGDDSPEGQSRLRKAKSSLIDAQNTVNDLNERWGRKVQIETLKNVIKSSESNYQTKLTEIEQKHQQNLTTIRESE